MSDEQYEAHVYYETVGALKAAEARIAKLEAALQFYATAWDGHPGDSGPGGNTPQDPVCDPSADLLDDSGDYARRALSGQSSALREAEQ